MQNACFFWDGIRMPLWNRACIFSFLNHGFQVTLFSYESKLSREFPSHPQLTFADAREIYADSFPSQLRAAAATDSYGKTHACFADYFRLKLLAEIPDCWWFDTDVFCLEDVDKFDGLVSTHPKSLVCGSQGGEPADACNAVMYFGDQRFASELSNRLEQDCKPFEPHDWNWAHTAIPFLNQAISEFPQRVYVAPQHVFFPIGFMPAEVRLFLFPEHFEIAQERCTLSLTLHYWNEIMRAGGIETDRRPPRDCFVDRLISEHIHGN
jgi:hypothetical protein